MPKKSLGYTLLGSILVRGLAMSHNLGTSVFAVHRTVGLTLWLTDSIRLQNMTYQVEWVLAQQPQNENDNKTKTPWPQPWRTFLNLGLLNRFLRKMNKGIVRSETTRERGKIITKVPLLDKFGSNQMTLILGLQMLMVTLHAV